MEFTRRSQRKAISGSSRLGLAGILLATALLLSAAPSAFASSTFAWSGEEAKGSPNWSDAGNWTEGAAPSGSVGTLAFPDLTGSACQAEPATATCYTSENDLSGLAVNRLEIDRPYILKGNPITIGSGGLKAATGPLITAREESDLQFPIKLSSPQTWMIEGGLHLEGALSAEDDSPLAINLVENASLALPTEVEVGPLTLTGSGTIALGARSAQPSGKLETSLNGGDGSPVTVGAGIEMSTFVGSDELGPLTLEGGSSFSAISPGDLGLVVSVHGSVVLEPESNLALTLVREGFPYGNPGLTITPLTATGVIDIEGAELTVWDASAPCSCADNTPGPCERPLPGEPRILISAAGGLTGEFANLPDGALIPLICAHRDARIGYTKHAVTATAVEVTKAGLAVSNPAPSVDEAVTFTAAVSSTLQEGKPPTGAVAFFDGGQPIPGCTERPLSPTGQSASAATCQLSYSQVGTHNITATFLGSDGYLGSASQPENVNVRALPAPIKKPSRIRLMGHVLRTRNRQGVEVTLDCVGDQPCSGAAALTVKRNIGGVFQAVKITDTASISIPAGASAVVSLKLNRIGRTLSRQHSQALHGRLTISGESGMEYRKVVLSP